MIDELQVLQCASWFKSLESSTSSALKTEKKTLMLQIWKFSYVLLRYLLLNKIYVLS